MRLTARGAIASVWRSQSSTGMDTKVGPHGACIAALADALTELADEEPLASVAVLTPSPSLSELYFSGLERSEVPRLHLVRSQDFRFAPGVEVTEIEQVKGLEFDYVILVGIDESHFPDEPMARRLLHVGATRAVHQLWLTSTGTPSKIVSEAILAKPIETEQLDTPAWSEGKKPEGSH